jgi:hypothetical protein
MSTKTTFKRIALVTVAAMGFGLLSVAPSTATTQQDTLTLGSATTTFAAGSASATNTITQAFLGVNSDTMSVTMSLTSAPATNTVMPELNIDRGSLLGQAERSTDKLTGWLHDTGSVSQYHKSSATWDVTFVPVVPGTYVVTFTAYNMTSSTARDTTRAAGAAAVTWTVTVPSGTLADATSTLGYRAATVTSGSTAAASVAAGSSTALVASVQVTPLIAGLATTGSTSITATLTGPGTLGAGADPVTGGSGNLKTVTFNPSTVDANNGAAGGWVRLYGDGTTGSSSIAISINGTAVGTATATFTGAAATVTATLAKPVIAAGSTATTGVITIVVKDANGNGVSGATMYAVSSGSSIVSTSVTTGSAGAASISLVGKVAGTNTVTIQNVAAGSTATVSAAAVSVRVGSATESSVTMTLDKATYAPGDQATITVTIKDAAGNAVVDGTYAAFAADVTSTRAMSAGTLPTASIAVGSTVGVKTYLVNVPNSEGAFTISALPGAGMLGAGSAVAISATATVTPSAASVTANEVAQAAADAAAEATDAANAATDAANAAAEAADAATAAAQDAADAVAALSTQVATLISGLKAQLTALTNLVIKIQKKVKA